LAIVVALGFTLSYPFAGLLVWTWFTLQNPHEETWGFSHSLPLNLIIAIVAIGAWLGSGERKLPPPQFLIWIMVLLLGWATLNSFFAFSPDWSWPYWNRTWKIFALAFLVAVLASNRVRITAIVWAMVLSLLHYGVKGGIFTIVTGGSFHVLGPPNTIISDNNQLALASLMSLPLANYLRIQTANRYISWALLAAMLLTLISVIGSYSRGAFIALGALAIFGWLHSRKKILYLIVASAVLVGLLNFMPEKYWNRVNTIQHAQEDASFRGRLIAWQVAYKYANDHFPFGAGFYGPQNPELFRSYFPEAKSKEETPHAAHSIYFQVLGEQGYIGLAIYLTMIAGAFWSTTRIVRAARECEEFAWAGSLALMIQMTLIAFCVGGAALSMAYYDFLVLCIALLVSLRELIERQNELATSTSIREPFSEPQQPLAQWSPRSGRQID
jgi:probable O-glycosylation ligase (exosortase A-associated)